MIDQKDSEEESLEPRSGSIDIEPAWWVLSRTPEDAEVEKWTWEQFKQGLGHAGVTVWEWDIKSGEVWIHSAPDSHPFCYDFSSPTSWGKIVHKEYRERFREALRLFKQTSWTWFDCFFRLATRVPHWVHARNIQLLPDSNENPARVRGLFFDATQSQLAKNLLFWDRKPPKSEEKHTGLRLQMLSERERHGRDAKRIKSLRAQCDKEFDCLFDYSNLPAFKRNANLVTIRINRAMSQLLDIPPLEIRKYRDHELWGEEASEHLHKLCGYVLKGESVVATSDRWIKGVKMSFIDHLYPCWNSKGFVDGVHGVMAPLSGDFIQDAESPTDSSPQSPAMRKVYTQIQLAAQFQCNVLLTGESGSGKDFFARQIHDLSKRLGEPFENFNCAALQRELAGSELFGHEEGAFTGAKKRRKGIFELVGNGTIFLNEIGDMPLDLQPKLLTVLETREFRRVGGEKNVTLNARIIAATNRDLKRDVEEGSFRQDLYHRLNVFAIRVPPLRDRLEELPGLVEKLLSKITVSMEMDNPPEVDPMAMRKLRTHSWPGNIRELGNVLERAVIHSHGSAIGPDHIMFENQPEESIAVTSSEKSPRREGISSVSGTPRRPDKPSDDELRRLYQAYIVEKNWSRAQLSAHLNVDSSTLKKWMKNAGLPAGRAGRPRKNKE